MMPRPCAEGMSGRACGGAPWCGRARRSFTATATGCPCFISAPRPSTSTCANGPPWPQGEMFTDSDIRNASKVCVLGQTLVRELFGSASPLGKEVRVQNVSFKVIGRSHQEGRQHDGHGPGRYPAGAVDHGQVPRDRHLGANRQSERQQHAASPPEFRGRELAQQALSGPGEASIPCPRRRSRPTRPCRSASPMSTRSSRPPGPAPRFPLPCARSRRFCGSGTACGRESPMISISGT